MADMAYIGREACGCATVLVVDAPENQMERAEQIFELIRRAGTVERVPIEVARKAEPWGCKCDANSN